MMGGNNMFIKNKNSIAFVFAAIFVIFGMCGGYLGEISQCFKNVVYGVVVEHRIGSIYDFRDSIDSLSGKKIFYHDELMDINSMKENLLGTRVVIKNETVVKNDNENLIGGIKDEYSRKKITDNIEYINSIKKCAENKGIPFLYCIRPDKVCYGGIPNNVVQFNIRYYKETIEELKKNNIPYLDYMDVLEKKKYTEDDIFFCTDHHWKPEIGFSATRILCDELQNRYGFDKYEDMLNIDNYKVRNYEDFFLGSYGKQVGSFFTSKGLDDIKLIIPKFDTNLTEQHNTESRTGRFEETVLNMEYMQKNIYEVSPYCTYSGGDFRLQIVKNHLNSNGKKILLIRDSFACVITPFLALQTGELHMIDDREGDYPSKDKIDVYQYIEENEFDYVIMIKGTNYD